MARVHQLPFAGAGGAENELLLIGGGNLLVEAAQVLVLLGLGEGEGAGQRSDNDDLAGRGHRFVD